MSSIAGRFLYQLYHRPVGALVHCVEEGGPWQQRRTSRGQLAMAAAARTLPPPAVTDRRPLELHLLSGRRFWHQSVFCLWSFAHHSRRTLAPVIYDDGTLADELRAPLARLFPAARFVSPPEAVARLDALLPAARFPVLRERWLHYPNIRKLIDPHLGGGGWKLVLDSDLLFFHRPDLLVEWLDDPTVPLHAVDCATSYGYSRPLLESLAGAPLAERVNVGLGGLRSDRLDWDRIETWCRTLLAREGAHYFLEQALFAMLVAGGRCVVAPAAEYVTRPVPPEADECQAVMHHYVAGSKRWYFQHNWRRVAATPA